MRKTIKKLFNWRWKIVTVILCILSVGPYLTSTETCTPVAL